MHIFIFPNTIKHKAEEKLKLNIKDSHLEFFYGNDKIMVDTDNLRNGSSTIILHNTIKGSTYALYNFREILQVLDMTPSDFFRSTKHDGLMQIDKSGGDTFIKVFLPIGETSLDSDTTNFTSSIYYTSDSIDELDWKYSYLISNTEGFLGADGLLHLSFDINKSDFWKEDIYISHAGQYHLIRHGHNDVTFKYNPTEDAYFGPKNCRYRARSINIGRLLYFNKTNHRIQ